MTVSRLPPLLFFAAMWMSASTKPTRHSGGEAERSKLPAAATIQTIGKHAGAMANDRSPTSARVLADDDFARGAVLTRMGTNEAFDFSPPTNATVCAEWRAFGAATDWIYLSLTNWSVRIDGHDVNRLRIFSFGKIQPLIRQPNGRVATNRWHAPLQTSLGVVPEANWRLLRDDKRPSQFWHCLTPSNTLQLTWQNVLLNRAAATPVSFQAEISPSGRFVYRYDLSEAGTNTVTNVVIGTSLANVAIATNAISSNVTSLAYYPLAPEDVVNPDRDGDGLSLADELFVYRTDPELPDTDFDGLSDGAEALAHGTDPLNPHSVSDRYSDGLELKIGDLDPFSLPRGSTNTILEHVFYSGTTNGTFVRPQSSDGMAVLSVSVAGSGSGDLIAGDKVVPLVAPEASCAPNSTPPLLVGLAKGVKHPLRLRGGDRLEVAFGSPDFAFGVLPRGGGSGHVFFPATAATQPCIHDFNARRTKVELPAGRGAELLSCTWRGNAFAKVDNLPPRSALITGDFSDGDQGAIGYAISHPQYLFGGTTFSQPVRFCPRPPESGEHLWNCIAVESAGNNSDCGHWRCHWGLCGDGCACGCDNSAQDEEDWELGEACPLHLTPPSECAGLHAAEYARAAASSELVDGVIHLRDPPQFEQLTLEVPAEHRQCCPCPEHRTNHVAVAFKSHRLQIVDGSGADFRQSATSCVARLFGVHPSRAFGDASLAIVANGAIRQIHSKTVLGVAIKGDVLDKCNALNRGFGFPMTVCRDPSGAPAMKLVANVKLPYGSVQLDLLDATGPFTVWYRHQRSGTFRKLLDTETLQTRHLSMNDWKRLMRCATGGDSAELPVWTTSPSPGTVGLRIRYWATADGKFVQDEAVQRISSLLPPIRLDVSRDGSIDGGDSAAWLDGQPFRYWTNGDSVRGDRTERGEVPNAADQQVNGTSDLVNFFPAAIDLAPVFAAWQDRVEYVLRAEGGGESPFNCCFVDVPWVDAGKIQTAETETIGGEKLSSARLEELTASGLRLRRAETRSRFSAESGVAVCEAKTPGAALRLDVVADGELLYSYTAPMAIVPVREMYGWCNFRPLSGDLSGRPTTLRARRGGAGGKTLLFLHGANVDSAGAEQWGDAVFKRMWLAGMQAEFCNVDWRSDIGSAANYHENASNAFAVAGAIAAAISAMPGEKVVMAHSLGNLLASSMIQDHGLRVVKYLMCNSSVPAEAYDPAEELRKPQLVHPDWTEYPTNSWASSWHTLFRSCSGDDRRLLGWPGRFAGVAGVAVNFYSAGQNGGDEVLELAPDNDVNVFTGIADSLSHHSWHKQELFKGRGLWVGAGATDWSGWNIDETLPFGIDRISVVEAARMTDADFRTNTVFRLHPPSMNSTNISLAVRGAHLALGIPALAPAAGVTDLSMVLDREHNFNLNLNGNGIEHPNGWPNSSVYPGRWLHSDMKDAAYYFTFKFYEKAVEKGCLR